MTTLRETQYARLKNLVKAGLAEPDEIELYNSMTSAAIDSVGNAKPKSPVKSQVETPSIPADEVTIELNTEAFERGGNQFSPPEQPGIYDATCTGLTRPGHAEDQLWFLFASRNEAIPFRGALVCGALNADADKSGAWKVKDVVLALGVPYQLNDGSVSFRDPKGKICKVLWSWVEVKGKRELRIQDVFSASANIEQAI